MPDTRSARGAHPKDQELFSGRWVSTLTTAVDDLSWLLTHGYSDKASLKLVGDRYALRDRQRKALQRCAAAEQASRSRRKKRVARGSLAGQDVVVDGYNVLLTLEAALSGGLLLLARDGAMRDLAAMSAHYRRVDSTRQAVSLLADFFERTSCRKVNWYLDRPVSNSGRLRSLVEEEVAERRTPWEVALTEQTDRLLIESPLIVATADSAVIDGSREWLNLAREVVEESIPDAWILDLSRPPDGAPGPAVSAKSS